MRPDSNGLSNVLGRFLVRSSQNWLYHTGPLCLRKIWAAYLTLKRADGRARYRLFHALSIEGNFNYRSSCTRGIFPLSPRSAILIERTGSRVLVG